jgi:hypothetical protein
MKIIFVLLDISVIYLAGTVSQKKKTSYNQTQDQDLFFKTKIKTSSSRQRVFIKNNSFCERTRSSRLRYKNVFKLCRLRQFFHASTNLNNSIVIVVHLINDCVLSTLLFCLSIVLRSEDQVKPVIMTIQVVMNV